MRCPSYRAHIEGSPRGIETMSSQCDVGRVYAQALVEGTGRSRTKARPLPWTLGVSSTWGKRDCCNSFPCGGQRGSVGSHYDVELNEIKYVLRNQQIWCVQDKNIRLVDIWFYATSPFRFAFWPTELTGHQLTFESGDSVAGPGVRQILH
jgi:hypothetical protein